MFRLIRELRQRRVFRGAGYYLLAAWGVLQVGDVIVEPAGLPAWSMTALLYCMILGFPIAMVLSWRYDIGEHGIVRTRVEELEDAPPEGLRLVDYLLLAGLVAISGAVIYQLLPMAQQAEEAKQTSAEQAKFRPNSVAVLPFADISQGQDQGYLGDGISDTVMHVLSQIAELSVTARTSSFAFKGKNIGVAEIARILAVAHVLEGSVQKAGDKVRIIARLIDARSGSEMWSGYYDRAIESIFAIQDEIAREVAAALTTEVLRSGEQGLIEEGHRPSLDAYEKFILGKQQLDAGTKPSAEKALALFEESIELDPQYALAYVYLGSTVSASGGMNERGSALESASVYLDRAIDLDPRLPEAHAVSADILLRQKRFAEAEAAIKRALELRPNFAQAHAAYSSFYYMQGDRDSALSEMRKAIELDPQENAYQTALAQALWAVSRAEEAMATVKDAIDRNPGLPENYGLLGRWSMQLGEIGKGLYWYYQTAILLESPRAVNWMQCHNLVQLWAVERARGCLQKFLEIHPEDIEAKQYLATLDDDIDFALSTLRAAIGDDPTFWYRRYQIADWLARSGEWQEVIDVLTPVAPQLFQDLPVVNDMTVWAAKNVAMAYQHLGDDGRAREILTAGLAHIERRRKLQASGFVAGIEDAQYLQLLGRSDDALARLERAVNAGWRFFSYFGINDLVFDPLRDDPQFQKITATLMDDMQEQLAWYDEHRDDPIESARL